ncbi:C40 family peptidase [Nocardia alni]|uniref:C40 family peptidase n=1 Tax=Nocardia alni TaxID=2815723 RepID=UPI001C226186|nr:NlpC/P60 family protein [Nocardia alni]
MTSPATDAPTDDDSETAAADAGSVGSTPWSGRTTQQRKATQPGSGTAEAAGAGGLNGQIQATGTNTGPGTVAQNPVGASAAPTPSGTTVGAAGPGQAATTGPGNPQAGTAATVSTGPGSTQTDSTGGSASVGASSGASLTDPQHLASLASPLLQAGASALEMLPLLASLGGSGDGTSGGTGNSAQTQDAINILKQLQDAYGNGGSGEVGAGTTGTGANGGTGTTGVTTTSGSGSTSDAVKAHQLYQQNVSAAFNAIDNTLAEDITIFAGGHSVNQAQLNSLLKAMDAALAHVGSAALLTSAGEQQVTKILTTALAQAEKLTGNTSVSAQTTAADINDLANQYMLILSGENPNAGSGGSATTAVRQAISVALSEVGKPYVYGAEGPNSFDCSGLTQYAAAAAGVHIPRTAAEQYQELQKVNPANIQPGDLIFPDAEFNNGDPGHVMMYIGNGECVEAPHTGEDVKVIPLPSGYHASRWA